MEPGFSGGSVVDFLVDECEEGGGGAVSGFIGDDVNGCSKGIPGGNTGVGCAEVNTDGDRLAHFVGAR